jgi:hypothetical protein
MAQDAQDDQVGPSDDVCMAIVYGDDEAPECHAGEIIVIARLPEGDRYRIPETLRFSTDGENTAWAKRVETLEMIGDFGALSCSTAGAGGFTGCTQKLIAQAYGEKSESSNVRFSELIAAARADRLSNIDEDAAAEQARVEAIEQEYLDRLEAERAAPLPDEESPETEALPDPSG